MRRILISIDFENSSPSSFWSDDEHNDYPYYAVDGGKTRIIWVTNYINNEDCTYDLSLRIQQNILL